MSITNNIERGCKTGLGGVNTFYLAPYIKYTRTQTTIVGQLLTVFPATSLFKVDAENVSFTETSSFEGGSEAWDQTFSFEFPRTAVGNELYTLLKRDYRVIYVDRNGNNRILGFKNGLESTNTNETGIGHADLSGYRVTMTGKEDNQAYFISDIEAIGFVIGSNFVFEDSKNYTFEDDINFNFQ